MFILIYRSEMQGRLDYCHFIASRQIFSMSSWNSACSRKQDIFKSDFVFRTYFSTTIFFFSCFSYLRRSDSEPVSSCGFCARCGDTAYSRRAGWNFAIDMRYMGQSSLSLLTEFSASFDYGGFLFIITRFARASLLTSDMHAASLHDGVFRLTRI